MAAEMKPETGCLACFVTFMTLDATRIAKVGETGVVHMRNT